MFEINRIGGPNRPERIEREEKLCRRAEAAVPGGSQQDEVRISAEAVAASNIVQFQEAIKNLPDIRQERVEAARQNIERGTYRSHEVVRQVADRVSKYVINE